MYIDFKKLEQYQLQILTKENFAKKIGLTYVAYNDILKRKNCKLSDYIKMCELLKVPFNFFIEEDIQNNSINDEGMGYHIQDYKKTNEELISSKNKIINFLEEKLKEKEEIIDGYKVKIIKTEE